MIWSVFKDGGKEDGVKCFFVRIHSDAHIDRNSSYRLANRTISEARRMLMHAHTVPSVAKYMARYVFDLKSFFQNPVLVLFTVIIYWYFTSYMFRFSLILSKTYSLLDKDFLSSVKMEIIEDIYCEV